MADRLSALPESVLLHLLSYLPMEDVVRTSILSKQWKCLWSSTSTLMFAHRHRSDDFLLNKFISFVDKTLILLDSSTISKFTIDFPYQRRFSADVNVWIQFAVKRRVEELSLILSNDEDFEPFKLPDYVFVNRCFEKMSLSSCGIEPTGAIGWESLKELRIESAVLDGDTIGQIVSGSPVLEFLELRDCWGYKCLDIYHGNLRKLVVNGGRENRARAYSGLYISASSVSSLEILGCLNWRFLELRNLSSLIDAKLDFYFDKDTADDGLRIQQNNLTAVLENLQHVKHLTLGAWCIQVLSVLEEGDASPLLMCSCLTLHTPIQKRYLPGIVSLLHSSRNLETLVLNMTLPDFEFETCFHPNFSNLYIVDGGSYWTSGLLGDLVPHIKTIKVTGFKGRHCGLELPFLQFLLKNSPVLKKMVITARSVGHKVTPYALHDQLQLVQNLLSFPRSSRDAVIIFKH